MCSFAIILSFQLLAQKKPCSKYDNILEKLYKYPPADLKKINEDNAALYGLLSKHTGRVSKYGKMIENIFFFSFSILD